MKFVHSCIPENGVFSRKRKEMNVLEAVKFFIMQNIRSFATPHEYEEAQRTVDDISSYRPLSTGEGQALAQHVFALVDSGDDEIEIARTVLTRLAMIVPGSLMQLYSQLMTRRFFWAEGAVFREAGPLYRDQLLLLLDENAGDPQAVADILSALFWIGDKKVQTYYSSWLQEPPFWQSTLLLPLERFPHVAGWELTETGTRHTLYYQTCYELTSIEHSTSHNDHRTIRLMLPREDRCGGCGRHLFTLFDLDLRDSTFAFLEVEGERLQIAMCPTCTAFDERLFTDVDTHGKSEWSEVNGERVEPLDDLDDWEDLPTLPSDQLTLGSARRTPYETNTAYWQKGLSQLGGYPEWVQHPDYPHCPTCQQHMRFIGQVQLADLRENAEGMIYAFLCLPCGKAATAYQQT
jgi:hypothetical protein